VLPLTWQKAGKASALCQELMGFMFEIPSPAHLTKGHAAFFGLPQPSAYLGTVTKRKYLLKRAFLKKGKAISLSHRNPVF